jgi:colanic acid biosynthesis glycosyl transferase WcaI
MVRVLIYALNYSPEPIGVGRYTGEIGAHLASGGHTVRVVTAVPHYPQWQVPHPFKWYKYKRLKFHEASIMYCPIALKRPMRGIWRLLAPLSFAVTSLPMLVLEIVRYPPEVIFCVEPTLFVAPFAVLLGKMIGARSIIHVQDLEIEAAFAVGHLSGKTVRSAALWLENAVLRRFDQVITISSRMRDKLISKGIKVEQVAVVRNWVDLDAIKPLYGRNSYREEFGWSDDLLIALYAGSVGAKQALDVALDAARRLSGRSDILFVVVGDGPAKQMLIQRYGDLPNVRFMPPQPEGRMCELLNLADVHLLTQSRGIADLVLPSKLGGMLASGKPVLATADRGSELYEVLHLRAVVVPAGNSEAIAHELQVFADGNGSHPDIRRDGRELAVTMSRHVCLGDIAMRVVGAS